MTRKDQEMLFENYKKVVLKEMDTLDPDITSLEDQETGFHGDELEDVDVDQQTLDDHLLKLISNDVINLTDPDEYLKAANSIAEDLMDHFVDKPCTHLVDDILSYSGLKGPKAQTAKSLLTQICANPAKMFFSTKKKIKEKESRTSTYQEPEDYGDGDGDGLDNLDNLDM